jgi:predicted Mrr-cat superfamily restriction endonuclease
LPTALRVERFIHTRAIQPLRCVRLERAPDGGGEVEVCQQPVCALKNVKRRGVRVMNYSKIDEKFMIGRVEVDYDMFLVVHHL